MAPSSVISGFTPTQILSVLLSAAGLLAIE
jgi:hypothetical protein